METDTILSDSAPLSPMVGDRAQKSSTTSKSRRLTHKSSKIATEIEVLIDSGVETQSFKDKLSTFQKSLDDSKSSSLTLSKASRPPWNGTMGKSTRLPPLPASLSNKSNPADQMINVQILSSHDVGYFKLTPETTLSDLRIQIAARLRNNDFVFQDSVTKRPVTSEDRPVSSYKAPILVSKCGIDNLLSDSTFCEKQNTTITKDGSAAFKVFWWDSQFNTRRLVWLKFEPHRIMVTNVGGAFKLFDVNGLKIPLLFAGVRGSDKGFQFIKGTTRLASRFFASSVEQKHLISIFFCFVWRPNAVRRGWLPRYDQELAGDNPGDATDPRKFSNLLRRHILEVDSILQDIERTMDSKIVRRYINMFASMFSGGFVMKDGDSPLSQNELGALHKISKKLQDWQERAEKNKIRDKENPNKPQAPQQREHRKSNSEMIDFDQFFEDCSADPFEVIASMMKATSDGNSVGEAAVQTAGPDGIPPPPPAPPAALVQKPAICPINFEGISASEVSGTIWAEMSNFSLKQKELDKLAAHLTVLFGRNAREKMIKNSEAEGGIVETGRLRNLEVLLFMEELKGLSTEELVDMILNFDDKIFSPSVLERLVRKGKGDGSQMAFLPSQKETESLLAHETKAIENGQPLNLRHGEMFFLQLSHKVPDRMQRFEFGYFMGKFEAESPQIESQLSLVLAAEKAIRQSEKFKNALKIILDILTTLMPRFGLTRGFRISSFTPSVERISGTVNDPNAEDSPKNPSLEPFLDPSLPEETKRKLLKLATLRKKVNSNQEKDQWQVKLHEYITVYVNRFQICQGFWVDLLDVCEDAMRVDQAAIEVQTGDWVSQFELISDWFSNNNNSRPNDPFVKKVSEFLKHEAALKSIRAQVIATRRKTEDLWKWLGEVMGSEPGLIFKYVHDFCMEFKKQWKLVESNWDHARTKVLRGALKVRRPRKDVENA